jgi:DNA-binding cell septation regulator SpoVG
MNSVSDVQFTRSRPDLADAGLLGWTSFCLAGVQFHGVGMRRTKDGRFALAWPRARTEKGRDRSVVHPKDDATRESLEEQILAEAKRQGVIL